MILGVLFFLLLLLAIVTCRVTGLPVTGDRLQVTLEAGRDGRE